MGPPRDRWRRWPGEAQALLPVAETYRISAQTGLGVDALGAGLIARLPEGPRYYPEEMLTDQPEQFLIREFIREQAIHHTHQEVPHAVAVEIEEFSERPDGTVYLDLWVAVTPDWREKPALIRGFYPE